MNLMKAALLATALSLPLAPGAILAATPADTLVVAENIDDIVIHHDLDRDVGIGSQERGKDPGQHQPRHVHRNVQS